MREKKESMESRKKEKEKKRKEFLEKNSESESEGDNLEAEGGGFSIPRSRASSPSNWSLSEPGPFKRPSVSPASAAPVSKNVKMTHSDSDSRRGPPGQH